MKRTGDLVKSLTNKQLLYNYNKIKKEKANPRVYGKNGTSRWVTASEFWRGYHTHISKEVARRRKAGILRKTAGKTRRRSVAPIWKLNLGGW